MSPQDVEPEEPEDRAPSPEAVAALVENHRKFLRFLERRVGSRDVAEDLLQDAFMRSIGKLGALREGESAVAWFYRVLRNAIVDRARRQDAERRALARMSSEADEAEVTDNELMSAVCACVGALLETLRPDYAQALRRVDLESAPVSDYSAEAGITINNAGVRLHRAREAMRKQLLRCCGTCADHGCVDCTCKAPGGEAASGTKP